MPTEICVTYPEMLVFAHTRLAIVSKHLMPCSETICMVLFDDENLHLNFFLSDHFNGPMLLTSLNLSSIH